MKTFKFLKLTAMAVVMSAVFGSAAPCPDDEGFSLVADPNNCNMYFECNNGVPRPCRCPEDFQFCAEKEMCSWVWDTNCAFDCAVTGNAVDCYTTITARANKTVWYCGTCSEIENSTPSDFSPTSVCTPKPKP